MNSLKEMPIISRQRNKSNLEDPEKYIKKAFGKEFKFSEEYLMSNIDPKVVLKAIENRYKFK